MRIEKRNELPETCFSVLPGMGNLIILKRDEMGYYPSEWDTGNKAENTQLADLHNSAAGINPAQVSAMQIGSMCGFDVPGANPQEFFDKAKLIETVSAKGIIKDPVISLFTPIEADLHRYEVAGKAALYLDMASLPEPIMSRWSHSIMLPDLVQGKPLVPVSADWHENGQCTLTLDSGCCVHEREINAGYQIIASVVVGPVEYTLAELVSEKHTFFATWERTPANDGADERNYYWGHYTDRRVDAIRDFCDRASEKYEMLAAQYKPSKKHFPQKPDKSEQESMFPPECENPGVLRMIPTSRLISGLGYQRKVRMSEVNRIVREWDDSLLDPLTVSFRDGRFNLVDGQHRVIALRRKNGGSDVMVLCRVYSGLTYEQEAELCFKLDKAKKRLSMAQSVNALLEAGTDPTIKQINRLLKYEGFVWALGKSRGGAYEVTTTQAVISAYNLLGSDCFIRLLWMLNNTWHGDPASLNAAMFSGMALFIKTYETELNDHSFVQRLSAVSPEEIVRRSKADFSTNSKALRCAKVLLDKYNSGKRGGRKLAYRFKG